MFGTAQRRSEVAVTTGHGAVDAKPRILHLAFEDHQRPGSGGGSRRNREINRRLASRFDITVIASNYPGATPRIEDGVRYEHIGLPWGYFPSLLSYFALLPLRARRYRSDLVVEEFAAPLSSVSMPLWTRRATLGIVQWLNAKEKSRQYKLPFFLFEWLGVRSHRRFVAVSDDIADRLHAGNPDAQIDVIPNGVEEVAFSTHAPRGADIVFLGRLETAQKGLDLLLDAYAEIVGQVGGRLILAGDGPDRRRLQQRVQRLGLTDRVTFLGRVDGADKHRLLASARVVAMPSRYETFGMVAIEALACGTPVVAYDIACLRAVVPDSCGRLVEPFDVQAFARALLDLYGDLDRVETMGSAGRVFARRFNWDHIADEQAGAYLAAISEHAGLAGLAGFAEHAGLAGLAEQPTATATEALAMQR